LESSPHLFWQSSPPFSVLRAAPGKKGKEKKRKEKGGESKGGVQICFSGTHSYLS